MGDDATKGSTSSEITVTGTNSSDNPVKSQMPCYSCARIQLPLVNEDMTANEIVMWEAVSVKSEVIGVGSLTNAHSSLKRTNNTTGAGYVTEGPNFHFFSVGGEPLELQALVFNHQMHLPEGVTRPQGTINVDAQVLNQNLKGQLDRDGTYPVELWHADPSKNENTRYFGSYTGGSNTPPVLQWTNTLTTVLLDENGVGPLCKGDGLFLSCVDICGYQTNQSGAQFYRGLPRYFNVTLRKRVVKNPYPVSSLISSLFSNLNPQITGQPMVGANNQIEEVRVYSGKEGLPADPDLHRFMGPLGETRTQLPGTTTSVSS